MSSDWTGGAMNKNFLRGFCQHGSVFTYSVNHQEWHINLLFDSKSDCDLRKTKCNVQGVLSPNQMKIIYQNPKYINWIWNQNAEYRNIGCFLEANLFLVARILKEAKE